VNPYKLTTDGIADLLETKNSQYGNSVKKAPECLRILYPHGITSEQMEDALFVLRILDKLSRIAAGADAEDPYVDIAGYAVLRKADLAMNAMPTID